MVTRWGVVSAENKSLDFLHTLRSFPPSEHTVVAVAGENLLAAAKISSKHNIPKAYGSYEEIAKDPDVEIVYIGSVETDNPLLGRLCLASGKHVLWEKPLHNTRKEVEELIAVANEKNLFFMEAVWSRCTPLYEKMKREIESGTIGDIVHVQINYRENFTESEGEDGKKLDDSLITKAGLYGFQLVTFLLGKPTRIQTSQLTNEEGVTECVNVIFTYDREKSALLSANANLIGENDATVYGTKGSLVLHSPFWFPTSMTVSDRKYGIQLQLNDPSHVSDITTAGLRFEAVEVRRCLQNGLKESPLMTWEDSLMMADIEHETRSQLGMDLDQNDSENSVRTVK